MTRRVWASLDDYLPPRAHPAFLGRNFANYYFLSALLRYGTFDEYRFYLSNPENCALFWETHTPLFETLDVNARIRVHDRLALPETLRSEDRVVFHQSDHITLFNALCRLRNRLGSRTPVSAFIHSISYPQYMRHYLEMSLTGVTEGDALFCSSLSGRRVLERCFERIARHTGSPVLPVAMPVVPLGIDEKDDKPKRTAARAHLGWPPDAVVGLALGRFSEVDKMDLFPVLQVFQEVARGDETFRLVLAGSLQSDTYLKMLELWISALGIADQVVIVANPDEAKKASLFGAADFFLSLSDNPQETFGLTLLEAMHAGLPLLVSDFDGYKELVSDDVGIRVPTYWKPVDVLNDLEPLLDERTFHLYAAQSVCVDLERLKDGMTRLYRDKAFRETLSRHARARFERTYTHRAIVHTLETHWDDMVARFPQLSGRADWMGLETYHTFSHYSTRAPSDDEPLVTTRFGRSILAQQASYPLLPNMASVVDRKAVVAILQAALEPQAFGALEERGAARRGLGAYLVLWMMKHGLLRFDTPRAQ